MSRQGKCHDKAHNVPTRTAVGPSPSPFHSTPSPSPTSLASPRSPSFPFSFPFPDPRPWAAAVLWRDLCSAMCSQGRRVPKAAQAQPRHTGTATLASDSPMALAQASSSDLAAGPGLCCQWCQLRFGSEHPFDYLRGKGQVLRRRSERSQECSVCQDFLAEAYPKTVRNPAERKKLLDSLTTLGGRAGFTAARLEWTARKSQRGLGRSKAAANPVSISTQQTAGSRDETYLGVFWPKAIYESTFGKKIARRSPGKPRCSIISQPRPKDTSNSNTVGGTPSGD